MEHLGDISRISGYDAPVVDCIIGGSPCQDLSVAGKRAGLTGERSGLFMEQIRIIKEMRDADQKRGRTGQFVRPRYGIWENVPGALSSPGKGNAGKDFAAVLEEFIKIVEPEAPSVHVPDKGWPTAGCFYDVDGRWSVAWRVFDAQFWGPTFESDGRVLRLGTPQRRKRVALVADFGGVTAPEILFERQGLSGHPEPGGEAREEAGTDAGAGAAGADPADGGERLIAFAQNQRDEVRDLGGVAGALAAEPGMKQQTYVAQPTAIAFGAKQQSMAASDEVAATLGANDYKEPQVVCCSCGFEAYQHHGYRESEVAGTLTTEQNNHIRGDTPLIVQTYGLSYKAGSDAGSIGLEAECAPTPLGSRHDTAVLQYIVRRLTPLECERLQGYPDYWTQLPVIETMTREEFDFWDRVRREWAAVEGKRYTTPKGVEGMVKWWNKMATSDGHRYKALGNSICLPGWKWICKRIAAQYERDATMGSLFDGIGGFPYIWQQLNGPGTCLWASEVEPFQIAVTRMHFGREADLLPP